MENPILQMLSGKPTNNIMMQAVGAMIRGESPQSFLQNLAKTMPELQGLDLTDLNKTAEKLYQEKGQDINELILSIMDDLAAFMSCPFS